MTAQALALQLVENPLNWLLLTILLYNVISVIFPATSAIPPAAQHPQTILYNDKMTLAQLAKFNGRDGAPIYIAITGKVFDVSGSSSFYGPDGPYGSFAGADASRGLALNSFDIQDVRQRRVDNLSKEEEQSLREWRDFFLAKYTVVGDLVE